MAKIKNPKNITPKKAEVKTEVKEIKTPVTEEVIDKDTANALLARINELESLVRKTWDTNKIKEYEDAKEWMKWFSYSIKLWPTDKWNYPIVSWKMLKNYVANEWKDVDQRIELTYIKDWKEVKQEIILVDFVRILERTTPILANRLENLDWSEVYIDEKVNAEDDVMFYIIKPKENTYKVNLTYNNQTITVLSTYLNA